MRALAAPNVNSNASAINGPASEHRRALVIVYCCWRSLIYLSSCHYVARSFCALYKRWTVNARSSCKSPGRGCGHVPKAWTLCLEVYIVPRTGVVTCLQTWLNLVDVCFVVFRRVGGACAILAALLPLERGRRRGVSMVSIARLCGMSLLRWR
jgi:hypothetical protein